MWVDFADVICDIAIGFEYQHTLSTLADFPQASPAQCLHVARAAYDACVDSRPRLMREAPLRAAPWSSSPALVYSCLRYSARGARSDGSPGALPRVGAGVCRTLFSWDCCATVQLRPKVVLLGRAGWCAGGCALRSVLWGAGLRCALPRGVRSLPGSLSRVTLITTPRSPSRLFWVLPTSSASPVSRARSLVRRPAKPLGSKNIRARARTCLAARMCAHVRVRARARAQV
jgi:hypothetical protein